WLSADDRNREREPEGSRADHGLRGAARRDPHGQALLHRAWPHARVGERRTVATRPRHVGLLADREQQLELLGVELVVVVEVIAEQGERLDERAATRHDLGTAIREQV